MALDGITVSAIKAELNNKILNSRIYKIAQPEADELMLTLKTPNGQYRLAISASATLPFIYLTDKNKQSPATAPNFCMLLRKHIQNGRITAIRQPSLERILMFDIEHLNELGDLCQKTLIVEIMGKHSNIIFTDDKGMIIDSIKHIPSTISSVREVLPGRDYFIPNTTVKYDPYIIEKNQFTEELCNKPMPVSKGIYSTLTGFSPIMAEEVLSRAGISSEIPASELSEDYLTHLYTIFTNMMKDIKEEAFAPRLISRAGSPVDFSALPMNVYTGLDILCDESMSYILESFYEKKNVITRIRQKSADLRHIVSVLLERNVKKYDLQLKQLKDSEKKDKYRIYGELINTYGYSVEPGSKSFDAINYYTGEPITIPLDPTISVMDNGKKYFDKYGKLKRTEEALTLQAAETHDEIVHLESIMTSLDIALDEEDLTEIREELKKSGYIRKKGNEKKVKITSRPFHYISSDGFHIYVGKNNFQNDELTFKFATGNDWWFHAKQIPGSHVLVKCEDRELSDKTFEEAAALAAYYSKGREQSKVEIDYIQKKHVKKPNGAKPGFVVYYTNYSMVGIPDISGIAEV